MFRMVEKCMQASGICYEGRHHGPHALRHSLATNLLSEDVPISAIANIMGHSSTRTTEVYLTVDEAHLKEISLEVPNA
jgi:integrase/recombinase XerD